MDLKTAVVCFFDAYPPKSGAGNVSWDFFESVKNSKKFFQLSDKNINNRKISNTNIFYNKPFFKVLFLPIFIFKILNFLKGKKKKLIIIEGASWVFYSFILLYFCKFFKNIYVIYRAHNIEYELRSYKNIFFIKYLTKFFEKYIFNNSFIATAVSDLDKKKIKKLYKSHTFVFPNSINTSVLKKSKKNKILNLPKKFIFFCGSYDYLPNKFTIDYLIEKVLPIIKKKKIYLVISGGCDRYVDEKFFINLDVVSRNVLKKLYKKSIALTAPLNHGFGTKLKIIEAICLGANVITTKKGIEGIKFNKIKNIFVTSNLRKIISKIDYFNKNKQINTINQEFIKYHSMKINTKILMNEIMRKLQKNI